MSLPSTFEQIGVGKQAVRERKDEINEEVWRQTPFYKDKRDDVVNEFEQFKKQMAIEFGISPSVRESDEKKRTLYRG